MLRYLDLPEAVTAQWATHLDMGGSFRVAYPATPYVPTTRPVWLLGQDVAEELPPPGRSAYARLVLHGLTHWPAESFDTHWDRDRAGEKDRHTVHTPLAAFIR